MIWFQGCTLGCKGCFNPQTHGRTGGHHRSVGSLVDDIAAGSPGVSGITVSGGEPFQQPSGLLEILAALASSSLTRLCFSGYTLAEIRRLPLGPAGLP